MGRKTSLNSINHRTITVERDDLWPAYLAYDCFRFKVISLVQGHKMFRFRLKVKEWKCEKQLRQRRGKTDLNWKTQV